MIAAGIGGSLAVVMHSGTVLTCGQLSGHPLGMPMHLRPLDSQVFGGAEVVHASIGGCLNIFITSDGGVYTHGFNSNAEATTILGHGGGPHPEEHCIVEPRLITSLRDAGVRAVSGSAGRMHGAVVDTNGSIWTWGANRAGQLGLPNTDIDRGTPQQLPLPYDALMVSWCALTLIQSPRRRPSCPRPDDTMLNTAALGVTRWCCAMMVSCLLQKA
jgi:alpha-tubulin suppressor-like RCC1 family protein